MKKTILFLTLLLVFPLLLAACGTQPAEETSPVTEAPDTTVPETEAPAPEVVFVDGKDGKAENDGLTPETAVPDFDRAFALLTPTRTTIVVINTVPVRSNYPFPEFDGAVTITAFHDGIDYAEQNGAALKILSACYLSSDLILDRIPISAANDGARICARFHNVTVTDTVTTVDKTGFLPSFIGGFVVSDVALNAANHLTAKEVSHKGDLTFSISGGKWRSIIGGNFRVGRNSPVGTFDGALTLRLGGSVSVESKAITDDIGVDYVAVSGANIAKGSLTLEITGGTYATPIYMIGHMGTYFNYTADNGKTGTDGLQARYDTLYDAAVSVKISGGDFTSKQATEIKVLQVPGQTPLHADASFEITGGSFSEGIAFSALGVLGDTAATGVPAGRKTVDFLSVNGEKVAEKHVPRLACCGDSITFGTCYTAQNGYLDVNFSYPAQLQRRFGDNAVVGNFGYPGSNVTSNSYAKYYQSLCWNLLQDFDPDFVSFALGTNNCALMPGGLADFKNSYTTMMNALHRTFPEAKVIMTTALYRFDKQERIDQLEQYILPAQKEIADKFSPFTTVLDLYTLYRPYGTTTYYKDKLHPNNLGYSKLADVLYANLKDTVK